MEVVVTTGAIRRVKLQSNRHLQQNNIQLFKRPDALPVAQPMVSEHWRETKSRIKSQYLLVYQDTNRQLLKVVIKKNQCITTRTHQAVLDSDCAGNTPQ